MRELIRKIENESIFGGEISVIPNAVNGGYVVNPTIPDMDSVFMISVIEMPSARPLKINTI